MPCPPYASAVYKQLPHSPGEFKLPSSHRIKSSYEHHRPSMVMAAAAASLTHHFPRTAAFDSNSAARFPSLPPKVKLITFPNAPGRNCKRLLRICTVMMDDNRVAEDEARGDEIAKREGRLQARVSFRAERKKAERTAYLVAAIMSSLGISCLAVMSIYYRFSWQMEGGNVPILEMFGTFALSVGAAVGMEYWARWAHRALWHASLWHVHESHHRPRDGPLELNDAFAIINAVPAIGLMSYGYFNRGLVPGLCFGAGLGITVFGMAYMFVHDGLVHRRFPVGPIANVPYLRRVAAAHQLHHSDKFDGVPYGLFLGPEELEEVGGTEELDKEIERRIKVSGQQSINPM